MTRYIFTFFLIFFISKSVFGQRENAFALKGSIWTTRTIEVTWENPSDDNAAEREWVRQAIQNSWESVADIKFTNWGKANSFSRGIRIRIKDDENDGPRTLGLGKVLDGKKDGMLLNFTFNNWSPSMKRRRKDFIIAIAVHEFGHALGFAHEHNRKDCYFCDEKAQGTDGDYWITTCDLQSVMNYCNPEYGNWGQLSQGDKIGVITLYGKKITSTTPTNTNDKNVSLMHSSRDLTESEKADKDGLEKFIKIYVTGSQNALNNISNVEYELHPTFSDPFMETDERNANFGIGLYVWGMFEIKALVTFKDGSTKRISRYLSFDEEPANTTRSNLTLNHTVRNLSRQERKDSDGNSKEVSVFLEGSQTFLQNVSFVEYELHSTFNPNIITSKNRATQFKIKFDCWGQFTIKAKVVMTDGASYNLDRYLQF